VHGVNVYFASGNALTAIKGIDDWQQWPVSSARVTRLVSRAYEQQIAKPKAAKSTITLFMRV
jgi:hypothetical protein